ncbi:hypothetical protein MNEG_5634 [Monoraphidium neglectum]|uniref:Queuosine 5'-phosphate N-glycosylase/hydrolase n=1 Tax=Monoraphidium neglectum TaxID=145388 RepID=A0A0D2L5M3_9CHLO|nr:hypothetical protein MNEG_5634 [Monoraphidium neglectum]KIZ02324.1 hypothetical protein MNEG_5634 [Monoraphidium neglectum]|eukprot:XP_013901343.1 hypothetical protein MNEG_5634 [Monoraphidium neglectum]
MHHLSVCAAGLGGVSINADAAAAVAARLKPDEVRAAARAGFPVRFETIEDEITFLAIYRLLDFGSEYDEQLRAATGRDARETMQFGALGLHLGAKRLDRHFLKDFSLFGVTNYFSFEARVDHPLADAIRATLNGAGAALERLGQRTFGQHILKLLDARKAAGEPALAAALVADLAANFPGFDDVATCGESRKAQALAADLFARFGMPTDVGTADPGTAAPDARFAWDDAALLAGDSGALAAAAWRGLGVVALPEALAAAVDGGQPLSVL